MLLLDVGNTLTKWRIEGAASPAPEGCMRNDRMLSTVRQLLEEYSPVEVYISWVGDASQREPLIQLLESARTTCYLLESPKTMAGLTNGYANSRSLGVDRWLAMLGVWNKWKRAFCVVDAGTALTLDFVSEDGTHLGGYILPGLKTMVGALVGSTALISDYRDAAQQTSISPGRNTNEAVCRGALISLVGGIERAKKEVFQGKHEKSVLCVIGGGDSRTLIDHLDGGWLLSEQLVLDGLSAHIMTIKRKTK